MLNFMFKKKLVMIMGLVKGKSEPTFGVQFFLKNETKIHLEIRRQSVLALFMFYFFRISIYHL